MRYYLGLDNGGTTTKAALFDQFGDQMGVCSVSTAMLTPRPGFVERDMEEMWQANCSVIRGVLEKTGISPSQVAGVAVCGHGKGLYLWGKDGKPARNGIISTDNRAYAYPMQWKQDGTEKKVFLRSCQHIMACQPVSLLAWLRDEEPEVFQKIRWIFECKDYIRFRLTGEAMAEVTDYSGANLLNLYTANYDDDLLELFGLKEIRDRLPPLCYAGQICGTVTPEAAQQCGLQSGTPVAGGMFDIDACALAAGVTDPEYICMIAGTWSINEYVRREPITDGRVLMNSLFCIADYYLIEESSPTSAGNEWFLHQVLPENRRAEKSIYQIANEWVASVPAQEFVPVFLPFLMASNVHPNAKGAFVGLCANHTKKHMVRSVYEGVAFCHRQHLERLLATRNVAPKAIRLAGGAAKSEVWAQMFADVMHLPVETVRADETGALGCAICAAVAVGDQDSFQAAAKAMCSVGAVYYPNETLGELYDRKYALYQNTIHCLDGLWDDMQALIENRVK